jgi:hypothetical protein
MPKRLLRILFLATTALLACRPASGLLAEVQHRRSRCVRSIKCRLVCHQTE